MDNLLTRIKCWWNARQERIKLRDEVAKRDYLEHSSFLRLQIMEFHGKEYISFDGVPVVRLETLKMKSPEFLAQARKDFIAWSEEFDMSLR